MSLRPIFTDPARRDLADIWEHVARDSRNAADRFVERIDEQVLLTAEQPWRGERDQRVGGLRRFLVPPYLVFYETTDEALYVLRVYHGARRIEDITFPDSIG